MFRKSTLLLLLLLSASQAMANDIQTVTERQRLENAINEIAYLQTYLQETKSAQKHNVRSRFDYQKADRDLNLIKHGIHEYVSETLSKPKGESNGFRQIKGDYRR